MQEDKAIELAKEIVEFINREIATQWGERRYPVMEKIQVGVIARTLIERY